MITRGITSVLMKVRDYPGPSLIKELTTIFIFSARVKKLQFALKSVE